MNEEDIHQGLITLITEHKESFYRLAYSYVKNEQDALDVIQDSIHKALQSIGKLQRSDALKSWFYKIVVRTSLDLLRKRKRILPTENELIESADKGRQDDYADVDLKKAIDELPPKYRTIIILRYFEDLKIEEVAGVLDENVSTVKTRLYKAHKMLRAIMEKE